MTLSKNTDAQQKAEQVVAQLKVIEAQDKEMAALRRRVSSLENIIVRARQEFRKGSDPVDCRAWLFRIDIDEAPYKETTTAESGENAGP